MAPRVTFQMEGSLREKIFKNSQILWPIIAENKTSTLEGQNPSIKTLDKESKVVVEAGPSSIKTRFVYAVDVDEKADNGRVYVEDEFIFDPKTKSFDCQRLFRLAPGTPSAAWEAFSNRLIERQAKQPFNPDNPDVRKFFEKVVLELPTPVAVEGVEKGQEEVAKEAIHLPDPVFFSLTPHDPPYNLEASHFRRMFTSYSTLASAFAKIPGASESLVAGLSAQRTGFLKKNPSWEKLHQLTSSDPSLHFLSGALISLSKGDLRSARMRLMPLRSQEPAADYLIGWIEEYEKALKNLYLLPAAKAFAMEESQRLQNGNKAWLSESSPTTSEEQLRRFFLLVERKLVTGEADTLEQALSQFSKAGSPAESSVSKLLLSKNFGKDGFSDLSRISGLAPSLAEPLLLGLAREKWMPSGYSSAGLFMDYLGEYSKDRDVVFAARKSLGLPWGEGSFADQVDFTLRKSMDGLSDPVLIGSLMLGQGAFRAGQRYALVRYGGLGLRTTLASFALGLTAEAPAFELGQRGFNRAFAGEVSHTDFLRGSLRNWLTFGALRGAGLTVQMNGTRILSMNPYSPFGAYTLPVVEHGASFGALHLVNEGERAIGLRPKGGAWGSRFASDGVFYLQAGMASYLAGLGASQRLTAEIRGLEGLNRVFTETGAFESKKPEIKLLPPHVETASTENTASKETKEDTPSPPLNIPESPTPPSIPSPPMLLKAGESLLATDTNEPGRPREKEVHVKIPNFGEVAAYTHVGIDKKQMDGQRAHAVNEDAYGLTVDSEGRPFLMVADGMGGHGLGEVASKLGVEHAIQAIQDGRAETPGKSFQIADEAIRQSTKPLIEEWVRGGSNGNPPSSGTVASAVRINPDGSIEAALTGDARLWVLQSLPDGGYQVTEPVLPHFEPTALRLSGRLRNSLQTNSHDKANMVLSGLGQSNRPQLVKAFDYGPPGNPKSVPNQIFDSVISVDGNVLKLQKGDSLLLMSDGIANFFNREQMSQILKGKTEAPEILEAIQKESRYRFNIFLGLMKSPMSSGQRMKVKVGTFTDQYIDVRGRIYSSKDKNDAEVIGLVGRDNVVALVYRHDPVSDPTPTALSSKTSEEVPTTVAVLPGEHHSLTDLLGHSDPAGVLEMIRLRRGSEDSSSQYWLLMPGGIEVQVTRSLGDASERSFKVSGGEHRIVGEIGEKIRLQLSGSEMPLYTLFLDGPRGEGQRLPIARLSYEGREEEFRFRSTTPELSFGRLFNAELFGTGAPIADHHFDLTAAIKGPERGYQVTVRSPGGFCWGEKFLAQGQILFALPGRYEIRPADSEGAVVAGASPIGVELPKLEVLFPEWLPKETLPAVASDYSRGANRSSFPPIFETGMAWTKRLYQRAMDWVRSLGKGS